VLESLEALGSLFFVFLVIAIPLASFLIWTGAKIAGIDNLTFWRVVLAGFTASTLTQIFSLLFYAMPQVSTLFGFIIGILSSFLVIKYIFHSSFGEAFIPSILNIIAQTLAVVIGAFLFVGGIKDFIKIT